MTGLNKDDGIDRLLEDVPLTIQKALDFAVQAGRMTIKEAEECYEAYERTFHGAEAMLAGEVEPVTDFPE